MDGYAGVLSTDETCIRVRSFHSSWQNMSVKTKRQIINGKHVRCGGVPAAQLRAPALHPVHISAIILHMNIALNFNKLS